MRLIVLILLSVFLPLVWGWFIHWLIAQWWPSREPSVGRSDGSDSAPYDFQI